MKVKVCVAEKPSVGRDIAKVLGATTARDGYMEGVNGDEKYFVTWAFGHLCGLKNPEEYNAQWKGWNMNNLPMMPERFTIKVFNDPGQLKQFNVIKSLIAQADEVINCGDAGQEGELIQRWIYQQAGCRVPVKRLWISSLTEDAIREGFAKLKDQNEYQLLYEAGMMRAIGDWLLGMNATRAYTIRFRDKLTQNRKGVLSIGRVQTPTLALIVKRQGEIEHFVPRTYWELKTEYRQTTFNALILKEEDPAGTPGIDPIQSAEEGQKLVDRLAPLPFKVVSVEKKKGTEYAPRLFDLTSLQVECNKKYSYSADDTLKCVQSLYEKHVTTYPRVDTTYLTDDIYPKVPSILKGIDPYFPQVAHLRDMMREEQTRTGKPAKLPKSKKVFDNSKVTDHHAIIPTGQAPNNLTEQERRVYNLIALRFIAAFYPDCQIATTTVMGQVDDVWFKTSGRQVLVEGWREVFAMAKGSETANIEKEEEEEEQVKTLPAFKKDETGPHTPSLVEKQTTPPKPYTEATLLRAMETAGKTVDNEELREAMKENGIGRPSTRAAIIEKLFQRNYVVKEKKNLKATPTGVELIKTIETPLLKSAELTGLWEKKLRQIERGDYTSQQFFEELKQMTCEVVSEAKNTPVGMLCPQCRRGLILRGNTAYGCSRWREGCNYRMPFSHQRGTE